MNMRILLVLMLGLGINCLGLVQAMITIGQRDVAVCTTPKKTAKTAKTEEKKEEKNTQRETKAVAVLAQDKAAKVYTHGLPEEVWWSIILCSVRTPDELRNLSLTSKPLAIVIGKVSRTKIGDLGLGFKKLFAVIDETNGFGSLHRVVKFTKPQVLTLWFQYFFKKLDESIKDDKALTSTERNELLRTKLASEFSRQDGDGLVPLEHVVRDKKRSMLEVLIAQGALVTDDKDKHPLFVALGKGDETRPVCQTLVNFLISEYSDFYTDTYRIRAKNGDTLVHAAIRTDDKDLVALMLDYFTKVPGREGIIFMQEMFNNNGERIYDMAENFEQQDIKDLLLERRIFQIEEVDEEVGEDGENGDDSGPEDNGVDNDIEA